MNSTNDPHDRNGTHDPHDPKGPGEASGVAGPARTGEPHGEGRPDERLDRLQRRLADFAAARGWEPYHTPKNLARWR